MASSITTTPSNEPSSPAPLLRSASTLDVHTDILRTVREEYVRKDGLNSMARLLGEKTSIRQPSEKVTVMIIGNHSAGKSSFINWYIGEQVQAESMAMETSAFTYVINGSKRDSWGADALERYHPFLEGIEKFKGAHDHLTAEISASNNRNFQYVDFVDTPGLTDGKIEYKYDVNEIVLWLAGVVDLVFVFFDPQIQATCARTMAIVQTLKKHEELSEKVHFFLTKADTMLEEQERVRVMSQLSQQLRSTVSVNHYGAHALDVRTIYLPRGDYKKPENDYNQIAFACNIIDKALKQKVQRNCKHLEKDCKSLLATFKQELKHHEASVKHNEWANSTGSLLGSLAWVIPVMFAFYLMFFLVSMLPDSWRHSPGLSVLFDIIVALGSIPAAVDQHASRFSSLLAATSGFFVLYAMSKCTLYSRRTIDYQKPQVAELARCRDALQAILYRREEGAHEDGIIEKGGDKSLGQSNPKKKKVFFFGFFFFFFFFFFFLLFLGGAENINSSIIDLPVLELPLAPLALHLHRTA
jgi:Dynamin family